MINILKYLRAKFRRRTLDTTSPTMIYGVVHAGVDLPDTRIGSSSTWVGQDNLQLADNVFVGQYNFIEASNGLTIEEGCQITNFVSILSHSSHDSIRLYGREYRKNSDLKAYMKGPVHIGKFTFIGPHVTIMPNTKIGKGSLVAAYSFLHGEYPEFSIISGNPAVVVGSTRERDETLLKEFPELIKFYEAWAGSD